MHYVMLALDSLPVIHMSSNIRRLTFLYINFDYLCYFKFIKKNIYIYILKIHYVSKSCYNFLLKVILFTTASLLLVILPWSIHQHKILSPNQLFKYVM
jgi:hypothetical protein